MEDLTNNDKEFFKMLLNLTPQLKNGYLNYIYKKKSYKLHRIKLMLHLNKKLNIYEIVHHKDNNKLNNDINNLEIMSPEEHISLHKAGKKINKKKLY